MAKIDPASAGGKNVVAFLDMIAHSEGTAGTCNDDGYSKIVSPGGCMTTYAVHPNQRIQVRPGLISTCAGRYQLKSMYYEPYKKQLGLPDFGPVSQDKIAIQLIKECKAYQDIQAGHIDIAIAKCRSRWASFPGAGYGQPEHDQQRMIHWYKDAGGMLA